jgi:hypothetical protein
LPKGNITGLVNVGFTIKFGLWCILGVFVVPQPL